MRSLAPRFLVFLQLWVLLFLATPVAAALRARTPLPQFTSASNPLRAIESPRGSTASDTAAPQKQLAALAASVECFNYSTNVPLNGTPMVPGAPDCAAGPSHVITVGTSLIQWRPISGISNVPQFELGLKAFFALGLPGPPAGPGTTLGTNPGGPHVIYDQYAGRFVISAGEVGLSNTCRILIAVSKTSDPNNGFWFHAIDSKLTIGSGSAISDYPAIAVDDKAVYAVSNMFSTGTFSYAGARVWIIKKTPAYSGPNNNISYIVRDPYVFTGVAATTVPAHMFGTLPAGSGGRPMGTFLVSFDGLTDGTNEYLQVVEVTDPLQTTGGPFFTVQQVPVGDVENTSLPFPTAEQTGSIYKIDTGWDGVANAVWRNNNLYCTATVASVSGADANQATAHWWRLNTTNTVAVTVADQGEAGAEDVFANTFTFFPRVMVDCDGNMALGFAASGPRIFPGAYYVTRMAGDPAGTVGPTEILAAGLDRYQQQWQTNLSRWGFGSGLSLRPLIETDFWVFNAYAGMRSGINETVEGRWQTRLGTFHLKSLTGVKGTPLARTALSQNVPNPFNPSTTIRFTLAEKSGVHLAVYDTAGRLVRTLLDETRESGAHEVTWDGRDARGAAMASGVYFYRLTSGSHIESKKMVLLK